MKPKLVNNRPANSRKKWFCISCTHYSGKTEEVAKFTHKGDVELYLMRLQQSDMITHITIT